MSGQVTRFECYMSMYDSNLGSNIIIKNALHEMACSAKTFDDWRNVFYRSLPADCSLRLAAFQNMFVLAKTFGQWLTICHEAGDGIAYPLKLKALNALLKLADEPKDVDWTKNKDSLEAIKLRRWRRIFEVSPPKSKFEAMAVRRIMELMFARKNKEAITKPSGLLSKI